LRGVHPALLVSLSLLVPFGCLGLLLFLAKLEDTLNDDVEKDVRRHVPEPIVAIPMATEPRPQTQSEVQPAPAAATNPVITQAAS
jgi:hypothetical protein